jgi:hypothetical protein
MRRDAYPDGDDDDRSDAEQDPGDGLLPWRTWRLPEWLALESRHLAELRRTIWLAAILLAWVWLTGVLLASVWLTCILLVRVLLARVSLTAVLLGWGLLAWVWLTGILLVRVLLAVRLGAVLLGAVLLGPVLLVLAGLLVWVLCARIMGAGVLSAGGLRAWVLLARVSGVLLPLVRRIPERTRVLRVRVLSWTAVRVLGPCRVRLLRILARIWLPWPWGR